MNLALNNEFCKQRFTGCDLGRFSLFTEGMVPLSHHFSLLVLPYEAVMVNRVAAIL